MQAERISYQRHRKSNRGSGGGDKTGRRDGYGIRRVRKRTKTESMLHKRYGNQNSCRFFMKGAKTMHFTGTKYLHEIEPLMQEVPRFPA